MAGNDELISKIVLMVGVALDELGTIEAEPDLSKARAGIASVKSTLKELMSVAAKANEDGSPPSAPVHA